MRRRLVLAIVSVVAGALLVAGLGVLAIERQAAAGAARNQIAAQVRALAAEADFARPGVLAKIRQAANLALLSGVRLLPLGSGGGLVGSPPAGLSPPDLHVDRLLAGQIVSGTTGNLAYAATLVQPGSSAAGGAGLARPVVLVITRRFSGPIHDGWLLALAVGGTLVVAAGLAFELSRRMTRPLQDAVAGTRRIAAGQLDAQIPVAPGSYPELASLTRSINAMAASLSRSRGLERQFLLSVSHDLRTPLTSIRGFAEAIADGTATDAARAAAVISTEARRLERLVQDLLELGRLDARQFSLDVRTCEVGEIVVDTAEGFRPLLDRAGLALSVEIDDGATPAGQPGGPRTAEPLWARADPDRLAQVLANLVENAYKFARHTVVVRAGRRDGAGEAVTVSVADDGPGIPPGEVASVFQRLYQCARTPSRQAGSGLGLAIVSELVAAMGATVEVQAPPAGGTRMVLTLASTHVPAPGPAPPSNLPLPSPPGSVRAPAG